MLIHKKDTLKLLEQLANLAKQIFSQGYSEEELVNKFNDENNSLVLDKKACLEMMKTITCLQEEEKKRIIGKKHKIKSLNNDIKKAITEAITTKDKETLNFNSKEYLFKILQEQDVNQISSIIHEIMLWQFLEAVWNAHEKNEQKEFFKTPLVAFILEIGRTLMEWLFIDRIEKDFGHCKMFDDFSTLFNNKYQVKTTSTDILEWFWERLLIKNKMTKNKSIANYKPELYTKIGSYFLEYLLDHKILGEIQEKNTTYIYLEKHYEATCIASSYFTKPGLFANMSVDFIHVVNTSVISFTILRKLLVQVTHKYSYNVKDNLNKIINTNEIPYCINSEMLALYEDYINKLSKIPFNSIIKEPHSKNAQLIDDYIFSTYHFDIKTIIKHCNPHYVNLLLNYMGNFMQIRDTTLQKKLNKHCKRCHNTYIKKMLKLLKVKKIYEIFTIEQLVNYDLKNTKNSTKGDIFRQKANNAQLLLDCFSKIEPQKFYIAACLKDAIIYKHFDKFHHTKQVTGVGRINDQANILTIQTNKFARFLINYYIKNNVIIDEDLFYKLRSTFATMNLNNTEILSLTYQKFQEETHELQKEHLANFFNKDISNLDINFSSLDTAIHILRPFIKKSNEIYTAIAMLHQNKNKSLYKNKAPLIFLDSTMSGTQLYASLFRDSRAAHNSCLTGSEKFDCNKLCLKEFYTFITEKLLKHAQNALSELNITQEALNGISFKKMFRILSQHLFQKKLKIKSMHSFLFKMNTLFEQKKPLLNLSEISQSDLNQLNCIFITKGNKKKKKNNNKIKNKKKNNSNKIKNKKKNNSNKIKNKKKNNSNKIKNKKKNNNNEIKNKKKIKKKKKKIENKSNQNNNNKEQIFSKKKETILFINKLEIILNYYAIKKINDKDPWILDNIQERSLIKQTIMADLYGMSFRTSCDTIFKALHEKLIEKGNVNVDLAHIHIFSGLLAKYFHYYFKPLHLPYSIEFSKIRKHIKHPVKPLTLETEFLQWFYSPKISKIKRVNVPTLNHSRRRFINVATYTDEIDKNKLCNSVNALIIHTLEARLMMHWIQTMQELSEKWLKEFSIQISYTYNYDCFGSNYQFVCFLKFLIKNSYSYCYDNSLFPSVEVLLDNADFRDLMKTMYKTPNDEHFWDGKITNPTFVKF